MGLIEIVVVELRGDKVRIGCNANPKISVNRSEVHDAIKRRYVPQEEEAVAAPVPATPPAPLAAFVPQG